MTQIKIDNDLVTRAEERFFKQEPPLTKQALAKRLGQLVNQHLRDTILPLNGPNGGQRTTPQPAQQAPAQQAPTQYERRYGVPLTHPGAGLPENIVRLQHDATWPVRPEVAASLYNRGYEPKFLKPNPAWRDDPQYVHLENKKSWIREGWPFEGMRDPDGSLSFAMSDIMAETSWDGLSEAAQTAYRVAFSKHKAWSLKQA